MTKRPLEWDRQVDLISSDDESPCDGDMQVDSCPQETTEVMSSQFVDIKPSEAILCQPVHVNPSEGIVVRKARMYQEYMKEVPIPSLRGSVIPCQSWTGLGNSIKEFYGQPLHYLTNIQLKEWDKARFETGDDYQPLDTVIHPLKAETTIWFIEEVHRRTASYHHLAKLWAKYPMYHAFVDSIFPHNLTPRLVTLPP